jgi:hypothetical protein
MHPPQVHLDLQPQPKFLLLREYSLRLRLYASTVRAEKALTCVRHWLVDELACRASMRRSLSFYRAETGLRNAGNIVALGDDDAAPRRSHDP